MSKFWGVIVVILALIVYDKWRSSQSYDQGFNKCTADNVTSVNEAVAADRKSEKEKQDEVDEQTQTQIREIGVINAGLLDDIIKLRKRANRKQQPSGAESLCKGATGSDLSFADAEFLTREAARADEIRVGLEACYNYADTVTKKSPN